MPFHISSPLVEVRPALRRDKPLRAGIFAARRHSVEFGFHDWPLLGRVNSQTSGSLEASVAGDGR
uniref:Uncharacterized protein n=1 Tax=Agrobacterium tumefaciens TaxID=358 RepID=A0A2Z2PWE6_AGRTU|nr:hypothetical protein [Agrobacterium radiobacter]